MLLDLDELSLRSLEQLVPPLAPDLIGRMLTGNIVLETIWQLLTSQKPVSMKPGFEHRISNMAHICLLITNRCYIDSLTH